jgi:hypothetical protein
MKPKIIFFQLFFLFISLSAKSQVGCLSGNCENGQGTYMWDVGGEKYSGEFRNGKFHGYGTYNWTNGDKYSGKWKDNEREGQGVLTWASGAKYSGEWVNNRMQGQCVYTNSNNNTWTGHCKSNSNSLEKLEQTALPSPISPPILVVDNILFKEVKGNGNSILDVNESAEISFTINNIGKGTAYQLQFLTMDNSMIQGIDYYNFQAFENSYQILPGEKKTISIPIIGTMQLESGKTNFGILVREGNGFDAELFRISFNTQRFKSPLITIADYKFTSNEEGKIKLGYPVTLNLVIQNIGQGEASDVKINFSNPVNVYPGSNQIISLKTLKPNESKSVTYDFFASKIYSAPSIPIEVNATESYNKYGEMKSLTVSLEQTLGKTQEIDVNGQYEKLIQINKVSLSSDVDINIPINNISDVNNFALIIGNEDYTSYQKGLSNEINVAFARNDALVFKEYCIKSFGIPENNITFLSNATVGKMQQAIDKINKLIKATNGKAKVTVYYAGHGLPDDLTKEAYLIPVDVSGSDISSAIKLSTLYSKLTEFPAKQVTVFLDACFSGGGRESGLIASRGVKIKAKNDILKGNIVVFTASSGEQSSQPWKDKQHGMFTYFLLKKFQETKGNISFKELDSYLKYEVGLESVRTNSIQQTPQVLYSNEQKDNWEKLSLYFR